MTDTDLAAPLATLEDMIGDTVTVRTKDSQLIDGTLVGYDDHLNLSLDSLATDGRDTNDDPRLIRGTRIIAITHSSIDDEATGDASSTAPDSGTTESSPQAVDTSNQKTSPALVDLKAQFEPKNLTVDIGSDGNVLRVTKLGQEYRIYPDGTVEGDGLYRTHLEQLLTN